MLSGMLALLYWDFGKCSIRYQDYFFGQTWVRTSEDQIYYKLLKIENFTQGDLRNLIKEPCLCMLHASWHIYFVDG